MAAPTPDAASLRAHTLALDGERLALEREIAAAVAALGEHATGALVDADGFPRADVDVGEVARQRGAIARLRNDLKDKMKEVEIALLAALAANSS